MVFAEKIVGDGIAIKPSGNKMVAPVDGTIGKIFETNHAFSIESDNGIELFVHFGIDTVERSTVSIPKWTNSSMPLSDSIEKA